MKPVPIHTNYMEVFHSIHNNNENKTEEKRAEKKSMSLAMACNKVIVRFNMVEIWTLTHIGIIIN